MVDEGTPGERGQDDGLDPFIVDRSGGKVMPAGDHSSGGGSFIDASYEDALRILGREASIPQPWEQRALTMDDPEAADLAARLTRLRAARNSGDPDLAESPLPVVDAFVAPDALVSDLVFSLQQRPVERARLEAAREKLLATGDEVAAATTAVLEHPGIEPLLADES